MGEQAVIGFTGWELLVAGGNLLVLYAILKKLLFATVKKVIDDRENEVKTLFEQAESAKSDALSLKTEYENNILNSKEKAAEIIKEATVNATKRADDIISDAQVQTADLKRKANDSIELEKKRATQELRADISKLVISAAEKVVQKEINSDDHKKLIDDFVNQVGE